MPPPSVPPQVETSVKREIDEQRQTESPRLQIERARRERAGQRATPEAMQEGMKRDFPEFSQTEDIANQTSGNRGAILFEALEQEETVSRVEELMQAVGEHQMGKDSDRVDTVAGPLGSLPFLAQKAGDMLQDPEVQKALIQGGATFAAEVLVSRFKIPFQLAKRMLQAILPMGASGGVEFGFQQAGLSEKSTGRIIGATAAPLVGKVGQQVITKSLGAIAKRLPGASGALNDLAVNTVKTIEDQVMPSISATRLWQRVGRLGGSQINIGVKNTAQELLDISKDVGKLSKGGQRELARAASYAKGLFDRIQEFGGTLPFDALAQERIVIGNLIRKAGGKAGTDPVVLPIYRRIYRGLMQDIEVAAKSKGMDGRIAAATLNAIAADRKEKAGFELSLILRNAFGKERRDVPIQEFDASKAVKALQQKIRNAKRNKTDKLFVESFAPGELDDIIQTLRKLRGIPRMGPDLGAQAGSFKRLGRVAVIGGGVGGATGDPKLAAGAVAGFEAMRFLIEKALLTRAGRGLLTRLLDANGGVMNRKLGSVLMAGLAGANPEETAQAGEATQGAIRSAQEFGGPLMNQLTQGRRVTR